MKCKISKSKIKEYQEMYPKVNSPRGFISSKSKTGRKIIKKIICYRRAK